MKDANTVSPRLSQENYLVIVSEDFPVHVPITGLVISASGEVNLPWYKLLIRLPFLLLLVMNVYVLIDC